MSELPITNGNINTAVNNWLDLGSAAATAKWGDITGWDVSGVTNFGSLFMNGTNGDTSTFDEDLSAWVVSEGTNFSSMFNGCAAFDEDLSAWVVSEGTNFSSMFNGCAAFNSDVSDWDVSEGSDFSSMFNGCEAFNNGAAETNPITWNTSKVTTMSHMFRNCLIFNQELQDKTGNNPWNTGSVTDMGACFNRCEKFNRDVSDWDISLVTTMRSMFQYCYDFNNGMGAGVSGVWSGNTPVLKDMGYMFDHCQKFNQDISDWDVSKVTTMTTCFRQCNVFDQDIGIWETGLVENMAYMLDHCSVFNHDISSWDVSKVTTMSSCFRQCNVFNQDIGIWETGLVTSMIEMFYGADIFNHDISSWDVSKVENMAWMFKDAYAFNQDIRGWEVDDATLFTPRTVENWYEFYNITGTNVNDMFDGATDMHTRFGSGGDDYDAAFADTPLRTPTDFFNQSSSSQSGNICFLGSTKVQTDQGNIRFDQITTRNTINGQKIKKIVKVINSDDSLIFIHKHAFGRGVPNRNTHISRNHGIYLDNSFIQEKNLEPQVHELIYHIAGKNLVRARNLIERGAVMEVKRRNHETLYNVLLETHSSMIVNNIPCETLNPNDLLAQKYIK